MADMLSGMVHSAHAARVHSLAELQSNSTAAPEHHLKAGSVSPQEEAVKTHTHAIEDLDASLARWAPHYTALVFVFWVSNFFCHLLQEEAVKTYTRAIEDLDAGKLPEWSKTPVGFCNSVIHTRIG
mgnify:CR=1 FL=1